MKIYTKTGDKGKTGLIGGTRVWKNDSRIEAYGTVDELNAFVGVLNSFQLESTEQTCLRNIQYKLFVIGSHLATDRSAADLHAASIITESDITYLENEIDRMNADLPPLKYFVLPGGSKAGAAAHVCRTVTRRAERRILDLTQANNEIDNLILIYINRLSDYFFILSRYLTVNEGCKEFFWKTDI